jgi:hypothetical protein
MANHTVTVQSIFGPKEITRQQFVEEWRDHMRQLYGLSAAHFEEFAEMVLRVEDIARSEFDRLAGISKG